MPNWLRNSRPTLSSSSFRDALLPCLVSMLGSHGMIIHHDFEPQLQQGHISTATWAVAMSPGSLWGSLLPPRAKASSRRTRPGLNRSRHDRPAQSERAHIGTSGWIRVGGRVPGELARHRQRADKHRASAVSIHVARSPRPGRGPHFTAPLRGEPEPSSPRRGLQVRSSTAGHDLDTVRVSNLCPRSFQSTSQRTKPLARVASDKG